MPADHDALDPTIAADLAGLVEAHRVLVASLGHDPLDPAAPSLLPGWTVGHVLTHLARNGDGVAGVLRSVARGEDGVQYPGGLDQRVGDIEAGAARPFGELVDDVARSAHEVDAAAATVGPDAWRTGRSRNLLGPVEVATWPWRRWREVEIHHVDLAGVFGPEDWSEGFVRREWDAQLADLPARLPAGAAVRLVATDDGVIAEAASPTGDASPIELAAPRRTLLAWLLGRAGIDGAPELTPEL